MRGEGGLLYGATGLPPSGSRNGCRLVHEREVRYPRRSACDGRSTRSTGLVVVDAFGTSPRRVDDADLPAFSWQSLAPFRAGAILRRIPRLIIVDD